MLAKIKNGNFGCRFFLDQTNHTHRPNQSLHQQATFEPSSKLDWHAHPGGQILLITDGTGYYQERGKPVKTIHKGDVIKCLPGVEHWRASTPRVFLSTPPQQ